MVKYSSQLKEIITPSPWADRKLNIITTTTFMPQPITDTFHNYGRACQWVKGESIDEVALSFESP